MSTPTSASGSAKPKTAKPAASSDQKKSEEKKVNETSSAPGIDEQKECAGILNTVPTPVVAIDTDFNVTHINRSGADILGRPLDELVGCKCYELFNTSHCNTSECCCRQVMGLGQFVTVDTVITQSHREIPVSCTSAPLRDDDGNIVGTVIHILDISKEIKIIH